MSISIIMGSDSDFDVAKPAIDTAKQFGIDVDVRVLSAHRSPIQTADYVKKAEQSGTKVFIAFAGKAAHLAGAIAANTARPVIGVPVKSSTLGGIEALLSTVEMPSGVPVATVAINGGKNAALLAIQMLAIDDKDLYKRICAYKKDMEGAVLDKDSAIQERLKKD